MPLPPTPPMTSPFIADNLQARNVRTTRWPGERDFRSSPLRPRRRDCRSMGGGATLASSRRATETCLRCRRRISSATPPALQCAAWREDRGEPLPSTLSHRVANTPVATNRRQRRLRAGSCVTRVRISAPARPWRRASSLTLVALAPRSGDTGRKSLAVRGGRRSLACGGPDRWLVGSAQRLGYPSLCPRRGAKWSIAACRNCLAASER